MWRLILERAENNSMTIKWNSDAVKQLMDAILFIEDHGFLDYAERLEEEILFRINAIPMNPNVHRADKYKKDNDGSYFAFEVDRYRISYRMLSDEIWIIRIRHTSRQVYKY
jgi:plasmid stabilization system protein ParE